MLVSRQKKFIFFHIPKTGGSSVEFALRQHCPGPGPINFSVRRLNNLTISSRKWFWWCRTFEPHLPYRKAESILPAYILDSYFKFAVVRNPYDWLVSFYFHLLRYTNHPYHKFAIEAKDFEGFVKLFPILHEPLQSSYIVDDKDKLVVDYVGRFEKLEADIKVAFDYIGVSRDLPKINVNPHMNYLDMYNRQSFDRVFEYMEEDFERFGYQRL